MLWHRSCGQTNAIGRLYGWKGVYVMDNLNTTLYFSNTNSRVLMFTKTFLNLCNSLKVTNHRNSGSIKF
jgi:hypothetical protein